MDWSYIAGFFDGDGCVYIHNTKGKKKRLPLAAMDQAEEPTDILKQISEFLRFKGIGSAIYSRRSGQHHPKVYHCLRINNRDSAISFFTAIIPFLIVKKSAASKALEILLASTPQHRATPEDLVQAALHYISGMSLIKSSRRAKVDSNNLRKYMKSVGINIRNLSESHSMPYRLM